MVNTIAKFLRLQRSSGRDEFARRSPPLAVCTIAIVVTNVALAVEIARACRAPAYQPAASMFPLLLWAGAVSVAYTVLTLFLAAKLSHAGIRRILCAADWVASLAPFLLVLCLKVAGAEQRRELFGLIYTLFLLLKSAVLIASLTASLNQRKANPAKWIFAICTTIYVAITPWAATASWPTGDEPHYLLLTHSLVFDRDFDVSNNYTAKDYRAFYPVEITDQHLVANGRGEKLLWHDIGTSILVVPGYWAFGRIGAMITLNIAAALLAVAVFLLAWELGASQMSALGCSLLYALSPPLIYYSSQIYPEVLGASCCAWAAWAFAKYVRSKRLTSLLASGVLLAILPWLCIRFWTLAGALGAVIMTHLLYVRKEITWTGVAKGAAVTALPMVASLGVFGAFDYRYFGTLLPNAGYLSIRTSYPQFWYRPHVGLLGMLLDRGYGLLPIAPVYLLALAGALRSKSKWAGAAILAPALACAALMSLSRYWTAGWCPPGRYILCSAALVAPFAALVIAEERFRPTTVVLGVWSLLVSVAYTAFPLVRYPSLPDGVPGGLNQFLRQHMHFEAGMIFPSLYGETPLDYILAIGWVAAITGAMLWLNPGNVRRSLAAKAACGAAVGLMLSCAISYVSLSAKLEGAYRQAITSSIRELTIRRRDRLVVPVRITNIGPRAWATAGRYPIVVSYKWLSGETILPIEGIRTILPRVVKPNESLDLDVSVEAPDEVGRFELRVTLVEEGVAWFMLKSHEYLGIPTVVK